MKKIDTATAHGFEYARFEFASKLLGRNETYGVLRASANAAEEPRGTLYFIHPSDADDRAVMLLDLMRFLDQKIVRKLTSDNIQIVMPNFGPMFMSSREEQPSKPYLEYFLEEVMQIVEKGTRTKAATRYVTGISGGGYGALSVFLRRPELFSSVSACAPALLECDFTQDSELVRYISQHGLSEAALAVLAFIFRNAFDSRQSYLRSDPIRLAETADPASVSGKPIYFEAGELDDYGFQHAGELLHRALRNRGIPHRWVRIPGARHDVPSLSVRFPVIIGEALGLNP